MPVSVVCRESSKKDLSSCQQAFASMEEGRDSNYKLMLDSVTTEGSEHHSVVADKSKELVKKSLLSLNELNDKFVRTNSYFVFISIFLYFFVGVAIYHNWIGWTQFDSLYFIVVTCSTVGYGDVAPITDSEKTFTSFYIIVGIAICGSLVGIIFTYMSEHQERMAKQRNLRSFLVMKEHKKNSSSLNVVEDVTVTPICPSRGVSNAM